ncbi:MAG: hypothetical protein QXN37_00780 [Candidatus Anstonellaceae archaeon]
MPFMHMELIQQSASELQGPYPLGQHETHVPLRGVSTSFASPEKRFSDDKNAPPSLLVRIRHLEEQQSLFD